MAGDTMKRLGRFIEYLPASEEPLSADVYFLAGERYCYLFDVGSSVEALEAIRAVEKEKVVILSHFHRDHTGNVEKLDFAKLYVGDLTAKKLGTGTVVGEPVVIRDGIVLEILPCPSPHTGGSLIVNVNHEYTLIADLFYARPPVDREVAEKMIRTLETVDTRFFVISHGGEENLFGRERFLEQLRDYFAL